ncbi:MAG: hypothetical protein WCF84_16880 [Anaerolineae bacterium]
MDQRFDEKGKYYTTRIHKRSAPVQALVNGMRISGMIHLLQDNRIKDELNNGEHFIAITQAEIRDLSTGVVVAKDETAIVNKDHVVWIIPREEAQEPGTKE